MLITWSQSSVSVEVGQSVTVSFTTGQDYELMRDISTSDSSVATISTTGREFSGVATIVGVSAGTATTVPGGSDTQNAPLTITVTAPAPADDQNFLNERGVAHFWENVDNIKQDKLTAGAGISITGNTISATGGGTADSALSWTSQNPVENQAIRKTIYVKNSSDDKEAGINIAFSNPNLNPYVHLGSKTSATRGVNSVGIGNNAEASAVRSVAIGNAATASKREGVALGPNATAGQYSLSIGYQTETVPNYSTAVGPYAKVLTGATNATAIGYRSEASEAETISVGKTTNKRRIVNVADGTTATDAATVGQIPTKTSDLTNDGADNTSTYVEADELAAVATSGSYNDLTNKPTIPTAGTITSGSTGYATGGDVYNAIGGGGGGPTVVQTVGTSTTSVMSQNAVTGLIYYDPSTRGTISIGSTNGYEVTGGIQIGDGALAPEDYAIAIGYNARGSDGGYPYRGIAIGANAYVWSEDGLAIGADTNVQAGHSVAIGDKSYVGSLDNEYVVSVGRPSNVSDPFTRRVINVTDPINAQDAATKNYVDTAVGNIETILQTLNNGGGAQ